MPNTIWRNPPNNFQSPLKRLCIGINPSALSSQFAMLDAVAGALSNIDGGQLWRFDGNLIARTEVSPNAYELPARANYQDSLGNQSTLVLEAVADYSIDGRQMGLVMTYGLSTSFVGLWQEQVGERIVALTTLLVGDTIGLTANYQRPQDRDPTSLWEWYNPSCGWMSRGIVLYGGWSITLGD